MIRPEWALPIALVGFGIGFFTQFRLKHHIDRKKVEATEDLAELYPNSIPPKTILTERGLQLYFWFQLGIGLFVGGLLLVFILAAIENGGLHFDASR